MFYISAQLEVHFSAHSAVWRRSARSVVRAAGPGAAAGVGLRVHLRGHTLEARARHGGAGAAARHRALRRTRLRARVYGLYRVGRQRAQVLLQTAAARLVQVRHTDRRVQRQVPNLTTFKTFEINDKPMNELCTYRYKVLTRRREDLQGGAREADGGLGERRL